MVFRHLNGKTAFLIYGPYFVLIRYADMEGLNGVVQIAIIFHVRAINNCIIAAIHIPTNFYIPTQFKGGLFRTFQQKWTKAL